MRVPERFYQINDSLLCFLVGTLLNAVLMWLIARRSDKDMRPYSPILLLSSVVDLASLAVCALVVPVIVVNRGESALISLGPLGHLPQPWNFLLTTAWVAIFFFSVSSLGVPFLYRYMVICRGKNYGLREFIAMLTAAAACTLGLFPFYTHLGYTRSEEEQQWAREFFFNDSYSGNPPPYVIGFFSAQRPNALAVVYAQTLLWLSYASVAFFGWRIYRHLREQNTTHLSEKRARAFNRQVSRALLLQALVPLVLQIVPSMGLGLAIASGLDAGKGFSVFSLAIMAYIPLVNPLIPMWVIHAYRRELFKWLKCERYAPNSSVAVAIRPNTTPRPYTTRHAELSQKISASKSQQQLQQAPRKQ